MSEKRPINSFTESDANAAAPRELIPLCAPEIRGKEWQYVKECLDTGWVSSVGSFVNRFEGDLAKLVGGRHAVATVNGTSALHTALLVAGVQPDDEVLTSTLTFIAPGNAIRYVGAWPVFIDAEPKYWQMDPEKVVSFLEQECHWVNGELRNKATQRRIKAIIPVHVLGHSVDMHPIIEVARKYGLVVIEDATEGLGARYREQMVGHLGDVSCFSFNGNKIITTGGGGMIVTDNEVWAARAKHLTTQAKTDPVEFIHCEIGYNYRLTNLQAAVGCAQLEKLQEYIAAKRRIAEIYNGAFKDVTGLHPVIEAPWAYSIWWMYTVLIDQDECGIGSRELLKKFKERRIQTRPLWQPLHRSAAHANCQSYACEVADRLNRDCLSLPCSVGLTRADQDYVVETLRSFFQRK